MTLAGYKYMIYNAQCLDLETDKPELESVELKANLLNIVTSQIAMTCHIY